jgi:hypothetical protein
MIYESYSDGVKVLNTIIGKIIPPIFLNKILRVKIIIYGILYSCIIWGYFLRDIKFDFIISDKIIKKSIKDGIFGIFT